MLWRVRQHVAQVRLGDGHANFTLKPRRDHRSQSKLIPLAERGWNLATVSPVGTSRQRRVAPDARRKADTLRGTLRNDGGPTVRERRMLWQREINHHADRGRLLHVALPEGYGARAEPYPILVCLDAQWTFGTVCDAALNLG